MRTHAYYWACNSKMWWPFVYNSRTETPVRGSYLVGWGRLWPVEWTSGRTERYRNAILVENFLSAAHAKLTFVACIGNPRLNHVEIWRSKNVNYRLQTDGIRKLKFDGLTGPICGPAPRTITRPNVTVKMPLCFYSHDYPTNMLKQYLKLCLLPCLFTNLTSGRSTALGHWPLSA